MFRQFVSARTHCATTCLLAYVCVFICMQSINQSINQCLTIFSYVLRCNLCIFLCHVSSGSITANNIMTVDLQTLILMHSYRNTCTHPFVSILTYNAPKNMYAHLCLFTVYLYFVCINLHIDRYPRSLFEVCNSFCNKQDVALHANKFSLLSIGPYNQDALTMQI